MFRKPIHVHVHMDEMLKPLTRKLERFDRVLTKMEARMSELVGAVAALHVAIDEMKGRIEVDVTHLEELLAQALDSLSVALDNDAADAAAIESLTAERDALAADAEATIASIREAMDRVASVDPLPNFPAPVEDEVVEDEVVEDEVVEDEVVEDEVVEDEVEGDPEA
jgi:predicted  nucleic acid-binding Zn-ribbon protein